jgi:hypothetical protein
MKRETNKSPLQNNVGLFVKIDNDIAPLDAICIL